MGELTTVHLGNSGLKVTELGFGGIPIMRLGADEAVDIIRHCFELGIRFFDTAHLYGDSEEKLGKALEPFRSQVVIATKVSARDRKGAAEQLSMSFDRLRTDRIDLIQCHHVSSEKDLERVLGPGGAYETLAEARALGKVAVIGFSSHNPDIAIRGCSTGKFATLQFPFNFIEHDPLTRVFPYALDRGMGIIGMKPLGGGLLSRADLCFRFLQQYPAVVPLAGIQSKEEITQIASYYRDREPLSAEDLETIQNIRDELGGRFCHRCEYCMPCENGVKIPRVLMIKSMARRLPLKQLAAMSRDAVASAEKCVGCCECIEKCPYTLPIPDMLQENLKIYGELLSQASPVQS